MNSLGSFLQMLSVKPNQPVMMDNPGVSPALSGMIPQPMAEAPQENMGIAQQILSQRFQPTANDVGNAALMGISNDSYVDPQGFVDQRMQNAMKQLALMSEIQQAPLKNALTMAQIRKAGQPDLPTGYRWNPETNMAEGVPGVDASFLKRQDPYASVMPVLVDGKPTFAPKRDVMSNPGAFQPIPTEGQSDFKRENALRDEFNTLTKDFRTVQDAYSKITGTSDNAAGDLSLLYQYNKLLDPGSVVRESEFATVAASGSLGQRLQGAAQRLATGERLTPEQREQFKNEALQIYKSQKGGYDRIKQTYTGLAKNYNVVPENVIADYAQPEPKTVVKTQISPSTGRRKIIYSDGTEEIQ